jgi:hypothetical protein
MPWFSFTAHSWWRRAVAAALFVLLVWGLMAWLLPPWLKAQAEQQGSLALGRAVSIESVSLRPWSLELTLEGVAIAGADNAPSSGTSSGTSTGAITDTRTGSMGQPQLSLRRLYIDMELQSLWRRAPVVDALRAEGLSVRLAHLGGGRLDVDDIRQRLAARPPTTDTAPEPVRFALYNLSVDGFAFEFRDDAVGQTQRLSEGLLQVPFLSNLPTHREVKVAPRLAFNVAGARFDSEADGTPFATRRQGEVRLRLPDLDLKPFLAYWPKGLAFAPQAARLDADLSLVFQQTPQVAVRLQGQLGLRDVDLRAPDGQALLAWSALRVQLQDVRPLDQVVQLGLVRLEGARVQGRRDAAGRIDWLRLAEPTAGASPSTAADRSAGPPGQPAQSPAASWRFGLDRLELADAAVQWRDAAVQPTATLALQDIQLQADRLRWPQDSAGSPGGAGGAGGGQAAAWTGQARLVVGGQPAAFAASRGLAAAAPAPASGAQSGAAETPPAGLITWAGQGEMGGGVSDVSVHALPLALAGPYLKPFLLAPLTGDLSFQAQLLWGAPALPNAPAGAASAPMAKSAASAPSASLASSPSTARGSSPEPVPWAVALSQVAVERVRLQDPQAKAGEPAALQWQRLALSDVRLDSTQRMADVGSVQLVQPRLSAARLADGRWWFEPWLGAELAGQTAPEASLPTTPPKTAPAKASPATTEPPWRWRLGAVLVEGGQLSWRDDAVPRPVPVRVTGLRAELRSLAMPGQTEGSLNIGLQVQAPNAEPGRLQWRGQLGLSPLRLRGTLQLDELPLRAASPYVSEHLRIDLLRGGLSLNGRLALAQRTAPGPVESAKDSGKGSQQDSPLGRELGWQVGWQGDVGLDDLLAHSVGTADGVAASEELLSWRTLALRGVDLSVQPGAPVALQVQGTTLADFYARLRLDRQGRFNLQDMQVARATEAAVSPSGAATAASAASAATAASAAAPAPTADPALAPRIRFGPVQLVNGRVEFSDQFIQPNYSASLTELNGQLSAFASASVPQAPQLAELVLNGRAEGTASLEISGRLNPLLAPLALDIRAKVRDLELSPLSPYSVKYAGHGIERGKLSMDVAYRISPEGQLEASNQIVLNQLTFGDKVEGAPNSLPVRLAVALLADRNGVIDINLPISGSINDPQFRLAPIIFRVVVNLIVKAVTAPFSLLASAFGGGGDELSVVAFNPGSAVLDDAAKQAMNPVAQALAQRPSLRMTVVGTASLDVEREAWRRERLRALVLAEKRRAAVAASGATPAAAMAADEYPRWLREAYRRSDVPKPRNLVGIARDLPVPEMEALLMAAMPVNEEAMRSLAVQRGVAVRDHLMASGVPAERLFLGAAKAVAPEAKWSPRAQLELSMK